MGLFTIRDLDALLNSLANIDPQQLVAILSSDGLVPAGQGS
jgi:hypothetical protein